MKTHLIPDEEILAYLKGRQPKCIAVEQSVNPDTGTAKGVKQPWPSILISQRLEGCEHDLPDLTLRSATRGGFQRDLLLAQRFIYGDVV